MDGTLRVTIRVKKYTWKEFVYDVCFSLYAGYMISDALSKRYLKLSISVIYHRIRAAAARFFKSLNYIKKYVVLLSLLFFFGIAGLVYTVSIPIFLFLAATGRIH